MSETTALDASADENTEYEAKINQYISEMEQMREHIAMNRRETQRLKLETESMLKEIVAILKAT